MISRLSTACSASCSGSASSYITRSTMKLVKMPHAMGRQCVARLAERFQGQIEGFRSHASAFGIEESGFRNERVDGAHGALH